MGVEHQAQQRGPRWARASTTAGVFKVPRTAAGTSKARPVAHGAPVDLKQVTAAKRHQQSAAVSTTRGAVPIATSKRLGRAGLLQLAAQGGDGWLSGRPPAGSALPPRPHWPSRRADPLAVAAGLEAAMHRLPVAGLQGPEPAARSTTVCPHPVSVAADDSAAWVQWQRKRRSWRGLSAHQQAASPTAPGACRHPLQRGRRAMGPRSGPAPGRNGHRAGAAPRLGFWRRKVRALGAWRLKRRWSTRSIRRCRLASSTGGWPRSKGQRLCRAGQPPGAAWRHWPKTAGWNRQGQQGLPGPKMAPPLPGGARGCSSQWRAKLDTSSEAPCSWRAAQVRSPGEAGRRLIPSEQRGGAVVQSQQGQAGTLG